MYLYSILDSIILILYFAGIYLLELAPYVIGGVIVGEALKSTSWTKLIYKGVTKSPFVSTLLATILGIVSPLCTYGTVPVALQLFKAGVNISPLIAFLSVSAMMNPQLFIITWGGLGPEIAIIRVLTVMLFGLLLGFVLRRVPSSWIVNTGITDKKASQEEIESKCTKKTDAKKFCKNVFEGIQYVGFYLVTGVLLSAVVDVMVPKVWLKSLFAGNSFISLLISAMLGVPLYACGGGVIPVVKELMAGGMGRGAALAFLFVGPATRITPLMALATFLRPAFILIYAVVVIAFALLIGAVYV